MARTTATRGTARDTERLLELLNALGSTTFRQLLWQKSSALDLTYAQSQVLFYVGDHPGCRMGDVGKAFGVTLPAVTHIVDRLEQKQFVQRAADPADRRAYYNELAEERETAKGVKGVYILMTKDPRTIVVYVTPDSPVTYPKGFSDAVYKVLVAEFKTEKFDDGLRKALDLIREPFSAGDKK